MNVRVRRIEIVSLLDLGSFRRVHRIDAQNPAADEVGPRVTRVGGLCLSEGFQGKPGLPLAELHLSQCRQSDCGRGIVGQHLARAPVGLCNLAHVQLGMDKRCAKQQVLRMGGGLRSKEILSLHIFALSVGRFGRGGLVSGNDGAIGFLRASREHSKSGCDRGDCDGQERVPGASAWRLEHGSGPGIAILDQDWIRRSIRSPDRNFVPGKRTTAKISRELGYTSVRWRLLVVSVLYCSSWSVDPRARRRGSESSSRDEYRGKIRPSGNSACCR